MSQAATAPTPSAGGVALMTAALARSRPIALHRNVLAIAGGAAAGIMLSQLVYWTRRGVEVVARQGWIYKTGGQWAHETGMTPKVQRRARRSLLERRLIEERRVGCPAHMEYRLRLDVFAKRVAERIQMRLAQQVDLELFRSESEVIRELLGAIVVYHRQIAEATASVEDALFLSRLVRLQMQRDSRRPMWLTLNRYQIAEETGLSRSEQETARRHLRRLGAMIERHGNFPRAVSFMLNGARIAALLSGDTAARQAIVRRNLARLGRVLLPEEPGGAGGAFDGDSQAEPTAAENAPPQSGSPLAGLGATGQRDSRSSVAPEVANLLRPMQPTSCAKPDQQVAPNPAFNEREGLQGLTTGTPTTTRAPVLAKAAAGRLTDDVVVVSSEQPGIENRQREGQFRELAWPAWIAAFDRDGISAWLARVPHLAQTILDEMHWCSRKQPVTSPVGLARRLAQLALAGEFVPEGAHRVACARQQRREEAARRVQERQEAEAAMTHEQREQRRQAALAMFAKLRQLGGAWSGIGRNTHQVGGPTHA